MEPDMNTRKMFESYLYDYLVKRNMHQTAEIFKKEADLQMDPSVALSNEMDAPEGFLQEWWSFNYDVDTFRAWTQMNEKHGLKVTHECDASHEGGCSLNEESLNEMPNNLPAILEAFNIGSTAMPPNVTSEFPLIFFSSSNQEVSSELPQLVAKSPEELLSSKVRPVDVAYANGSKDESFIQNTAQPYSGFTKEPDPMLESLLHSFWLFEHDQPSLCDKITIKESSGNTENSPAHGEENINVNEFINSPSTLPNDDNNETTDDSNLIN